MSEREVHEAALIFPLMNGVELSGLVEDIRQHGLLEPIVLFKGKVLDGRNRLRACEMASVNPKFVETDLSGLSPVEWVVSHNLHRRHLSTAQRAALALDLLPRLEEEARERMSEGGKGSPISDDLSGRSDEKAAELVGIGRSTVALAKTIQEKKPEVVDRMRAGEYASVSAAARDAGMRKTPTNPGRGRGPVWALDTGEIDALGRSKPVYYGSGDRWEEASEPLRRYLRAHKKRGFVYGHVRPRDAANRVKLINELVESLTAARVDLERRAIPARPFRV